MRAVLAIVLVVFASVSGCIGGEDAEPKQSSTDPGSDGTTATTSTALSGSGGTTPPTSTSAPPTQPGQNQPPTADLKASALSGPAPFSVVFELSGSDPDSSSLSWTLQIGDGAPEQGTTLPTSVNHTFETPGDVNVTLVVSDGELSANSTLTISVLAGTAGPVGPAKLFLVGTGTDAVVVNSDSFDPATLSDKPYALSKAGHGAKETSYLVVGLWNLDSYNNPFIPSFLYEAPVTFSGEEIVLTTFVDFTAAPNAAAAGTFDVYHQIICTKEGTNTILGPAGGWSGSVAPGLGSGVKLEVKVKPKAAECEKIMFQTGTQYIDGSGPFPATWYWGSEKYNANIQFGPADIVG